MSTIGLLEAKSKFSELCEQIASNGEAIIVTKDGQPLVKIEPINRVYKKRTSVWDSRAEDERLHGPWTESLELPEREPADFKNSLGF